MLKIGKFVNTHGIKGEIRIKSDFSRKDLIFKKGNYIYINNNKFLIKSYRVHKNYDMLTFDGINNINEILPFKGNLVYIDPNNIHEFIIEDLIKYNIKIKSDIYSVKEVLKNNGKILIRLSNNKLVPYEDVFIVNKDEESKTITMNYPIDI